MADLAIGTDNIHTVYSVSPPFYVDKLMWQDNFDWDYNYSHPTWYYMKLEFLVFKLSVYFLSTGQKTCLHLHGIFPYIYVPYDGYNQQPERYMRLVAFSIDRAVNVTMGNPASSAQHIFKVTLVSGM